MFPKVKDLVFKFSVQVNFTEILTGLFNQYSLKIFFFVDKAF